MIKQACIGSLLFLMATTAWQSSHAEDATKADLLSCSKLGDDLERLSCFDRVVQQLRSGAPPAPVAATAPHMFGLRPPSEPAAAEAGPPRTALKSISAHVTALHEAQRRLTMVLDNGQKWQQLGTEDLLLKVGDGVKISRGAFSSFVLMTEGNRVTHVKRIE